MAAALCAAAVSCDEEESSYILPVSKIKIESSHLDLNAKADTAVVKIASEGALSARSSVSDWITVKVEGSNVYAYTVQNNDYYARAARLVIYQGGDSISVTVQQRGLSYATEGADANVSADGGIVSFAVRHNVDIEFSNVPEWITTSFDTDSAYINVQPNTTGYSRSTYVYYTVGNNTDSVFIAQAHGVVLSVDKHKISIPSEAGDTNIDAECNFTIEFTAFPEWLKPSTNETGIVLTSTENAGKNTRSGYVVFHAGEVNDSILVSQDGNLIYEIEKNNILADEAAQEISISLRHSLSVEYGELPEWLNLTVNDDNITLTFTANTTGNYRQAEITLHTGPADDGIDDVLTVTQYALCGDYYLAFYQSDDEGAKTDKLGYFLAQIVKDSEGNYSLLIPNYNWSFAITVDKENATISIANAQLLGQLSSYYIFNAFGNSEYEPTFSTSVVSSLKFVFSKDNQVAQFGGQLGSTDYKIDLLGLYASETESTDNILGYIKLLYNPYLLKIPDDI